MTDRLKFCLMDRSQQQQAGFTLLEILIGLGILLFILYFVLKMNFVNSELAYDNQIELERIYLARSAMELVAAGLEARIGSEIADGTFDAFLTEFALNEDEDEGVGISDIQYDDETGMKNLASSSFELDVWVSRMSPSAEYAAKFVISVRVVPAGADKLRYEPLRHDILVKKDLEEE